MVVRDASAPLRTCDESCVAARPTPLAPCGQQNERIVAVLASFIIVIAYAIIGCSRRPLMTGSVTADLNSASSEEPVPRFHLSTNFCSPTPEEAPEASGMGRWLVVLALSHAIVWTEVISQLLKIYIRRYGTARVAGSGVMQGRLPDHNASCHAGGRLPPLTVLTEWGCGRTRLAAPLPPAAVAPLSSSV